MLTATVGCLVVASDQWTKSRIEAGLGPGFPSSRIDLIGDWFALEYAENRGVAFGFLGTNPELVTVVSLVILSLVLVYALRRDGASSWFWLGMGLLIGGAVGNLIDRFRLGYVIDFVAIGPWPNFNVADAAIAIGVALLAIDALGPPGSSESAERERRRRPAMSDADSSHG